MRKVIEYRESPFVNTKLLYYFSFYNVLYYVGYIQGFQFINTRLLQIHTSLVNGRPGVDGPSDLLQVSVYLRLSLCF